MEIRDDVAYLGDIDIREVFMEFLRKNVFPGGSGLKILDLSASVWMYLLKEYWILQKLLQKK